MATKASDEETCQAVLDFVTEGNYPESGNVAASEISASALSKELELISKARDQVEVSAPCFSLAIIRVHTKSHFELGRNKYIESRERFRRRWLDFASETDARGH